VCVCVSVSVCVCVCVRAFIVSWCADLLANEQTSVVVGIRVCVCIQLEYRAKG